MVYCPSGAWVQWELVSSDHDLALFTGPKCLCDREYRRSGFRGPHEYAEVVMFSSGTLANRLVCEIDPNNIWWLCFIVIAVVDGGYSTANFGWHQVSRLDCGVLDSFNKSNMLLMSSGTSACTGQATQ